jgi:hypothetical protein
LVIVTDLFDELLECAKRRVTSRFTAISEPMTAGARQIDATAADEVVASAAVAYPYHGGGRTDVRRLIAVRRWTVSS